MIDSQSLGFRVTQGGHMAGAEDPPERVRAVPEAAPTRPGGGKRTAVTIGGWTLAVLGGVLAISGIALVIVHLTQRGKDGYYTSSTTHVAAPGYAVTAEGLHIGDLPSVATDVVGRVRVTAKSNNGQALFVGIAPQHAVAAYLTGVAHSEVTDVNGDDTVIYKTHPGKAPAGPPARQAFWRSTGSGRGQVTATWRVTGGTWSIVLMNASAAPRINAAVSVGAKTNLLLWLGLGSLLAGLIAGGAGAAMLLSSRSPRPTAA
jgi:hypothetical protein